MAYRENDSQRRNDSVRYDLKEHIGVLSIKDTGWAREVNIISWNGGTPKVDIREWNPKHERMSKGVTLFEEEAEMLTKLLARRYGLRLMDGDHARREFIKDENDAPFTGKTEGAEPAAVPVSEVVAACVAETAARMADYSPPPAQ